MSRAFSPTWPHLVGAQGEALDLDAPGGGPVPSGLQRGADAWQVLPELRAERLQLGLHDLAHEALGTVADLERLHVQLVADHRGELVLPVERAVIPIVRVERRQ